MLGVSSRRSHSESLSLTWILYLKILLTLQQFYTEGAIMAPPWANPKLNPCAALPNGWQLLFWPPDGRCYKIFQIGHPCPEEMELSPSISKSNQSLLAECRCPPETAQSATDGRCYKLFTLGPCEVGYYFGPDTQYKETDSKRQWGVCKQTKACTSRSLIYWPKTNKCYQKLSRGPCPKGQLLAVDQSTKIPVCKCNNHKELKDYRYEDGKCYQHFTRGPCWERGHLFLPDKSCGCHSFLPHFHDDSQQCYELDTIGPCNPGQIYQLHPETRHALCQCKSGYIQYKDSQSCYRPYTQGPCPSKHILINTTTCIEQPCGKGHLYFPKENKCYRIGSRGPCAENYIVTFDFNTRPSIDGLSYNGLCMCETKNCSIPTVESIKCDRTIGLVKYNNECHKMYVQGPCPRGSWLVPRRQGREELFTAADGELSGYCECIPGYKRTIRSSAHKNVTVCMSPTAILADYLNRNFTATAQVIKIK
ncbi:hypothetical protein NQ315_003914 [Exocentrus adspersus]|uniref:DUF4789 domain-containing protein n=1 Tax=Exocentrus adspersus TaxID=1586481 RepID=A0AAV8VYK5_9CUCU|nr:hypothetical protein NQ315_003914 [Exocentrus adspersus]